MYVKLTVSMCFSDRLTACPVCTTDPELGNQRKTNGWMRMPLFHLAGLYF